MNSWSYSPGLDRVLSSLRPFGPEGERRFPEAKISRSSSRIAGTEEPIDWLRRIVEEYFSGDVKPLLVEENLVLLARVAWRSNEVLTFASIQVLVSVNCSMESRLEVGASGEIDYFRFDFHPEEPGEFAREPHPHVHIRPKGAPRVSVHAPPLDGGVSTFLEWIYLNYHYEKWIRWAEERWNASQYSKAGDLPDFRSLMDAVKTNERGYLEKHAAAFSVLKNVLVDSRKNLLPLAPDMEYLDLYNHR